MKVWLLEYSQYDGTGRLTFRDIRATCEYQAKAQRLMREDVSAKRPLRVNPETKADNPNSYVLKSVGMSEVWQVNSYYLDAEQN
jgi:hypothetical protein